ncbi:MAG: hypothetical protein R2851_00690 [Caldilineaceae bacterium]
MQKGGSPPPNEQKAGLLSLRIDVAEVAELLLDEELHEVDAVAVVVAPVGVPHQHAQIHAVAESGLPVGIAHQRRVGPNFAGQSTAATAADADLCGRARSWATGCVAVAVGVAVGRGVAVGVGVGGIWPKGSWAMSVLHSTNWDAPS